jgi:hypothetical protein
MLDIVDQYRKRYHEAERTHKHIIIGQVMELIHSTGGRFLGKHFLICCCCYRSNHSDSNFHPLR